MPTVDDYKKIFRDEGFASIYEWQDKPHTTYSPHQHRGKVSLYIIEGDVTFAFPDHQVKLQVGDRFDVPVATEHSARVGDNGCTYVVGEEIEGDS